MGVFSSRDLFSPKFTTAIVSDANNRWFPIPIKNVLGEYFIASIEDQTFVFKLDPTREKTYRAKGIKSVKILQYDTTHINPVSPENNKLVEKFLQENKLHKVNRTLLNSLKYIGDREKHDTNKEFEKIDLETFFNEVATEEEEYAQEAKNFQTFFKNLGVNEIVTPTKKISEFLYEDLITTMPQFHGVVVKAYESAKGIHAKVTNKPKTAKTNWMVIIMIIAFVGLGAGMLIWAVTSGAFSHILPSLPGSVGPTLPGATGNTKLTMQEIGSQYPTPQLLVSAIKAQHISCSQLPSDAIKMVNDPTGGGAPNTCP